MKKRKICVFSTNRADYGHLKSLIGKIYASKKLKLQFVVTGSHLSKQHGYTVNEIIKDKIQITKKIKINVSKNYKSSEIIKTNSNAIIKFNKCLIELEPDIILILGDRYELLPIAEAALFNNMPLAHLHGGEITEGVFDEQIRHAITKFSDIHFVANKFFFNNVKRLGEDRKNIFNVGSLGCENLKKSIFKSKQEIQKLLNVKFYKKNILVTLHPLSDRRETVNTIKNLLNALRNLKDTKILFTGTNSDLNSDIIIKQVNKFVKKNRKAVFFKSLGQKNYLSLLKIVDGIVGNSSSGFIEAPVLKVPVINIGNRQNGRPKDKNIIFSQPNSDQILFSIKKIYNAKFKKNLKNTKSFYFKQNTSNRIINVLINKKLKNIKIKKFN